MTDRQFALVFDGTDDVSPEALRRLKGAFIADLEFSAERVREILEQAPIVIQAAERKDKLQRSLNVLQKAGARVRIAEPEADPASIAPPPLEEQESFSFEFELGTTEEASAPTAVEDELDPDELRSEIDSLLGTLESSTVTPHRTDISLELEPLLKLDEPRHPAERPVGVSLQDLVDEASPSYDAASNEALSADAEDVAPADLDFDDSDLTIGPPPELPEEAMESEPAMLDPEPRVEEMPKRVAPLQQVPRLAQSEPMPRQYRRESIERTIGVDIALPEKHRRFEIRAETLFSVALSIAVLLIGNWVYFSIQDYRSLDKKASTPLQAAAQGDTDQAEDLAGPTTPPVMLIGKDAHTGDEVRSRFILQDGRLTSVLIRLTTPPPPEPTKEELANNTPPRPWLKRIDAQDLEIRALGEGDFTARGYAHAFVEHGSLHRRFPVEVSITGHADAANNRIEAKVRFIRNYPEFAIETENVLEALPDGDVRIFVTTSIVAATREGL